MNRSRSAIVGVFLLAVLAIVAFTWWSQAGGGGAISALSPNPPASREPTVRLTMLYSTEKRAWIETAQQRFSAAHPEIGIDLVGMGSIEAAQAILDGDQTPAVFSPADSLVLNMFHADWETKHHESPFLQSFSPEPLLITPLVFAAWEDRGDLLAKAGQGHITWGGLHDALVDNRGWPSVGGASDWGFVKLGHTDPTRSNSGLQALTLMTMEYYRRPTLTVGDLLDPAYQKWMKELEGGVARFEESTGTFMTDMIRFGPSKYDVSVVYESLAIAQMENAQGRWGNLRVYYPSPTLWSDHPVAILSSGMSKEVEAAARVWIDWLRSDEMQRDALLYGFRPGNPSVAIVSADPSNPFVKYAAFGVKVEVPPVAQPPEGAVVRNMMTMWSRTVRR